uniref:Ig-like domain-containing protein n=1 Tax=Oreochromis aureus TaxID=47969 RepID=A0A668RNN3_OREAU
MPIHQLTLVKVQDKFGLMMWPVQENIIGAVTWGQAVTITCSISTQHLGGTFTLQQTSGPFRKSQTSSTNSVTFNIPQVTFSNEGSYQCQYQTRVSSRDFRSPQSDSMRETLTMLFIYSSVILPKPSISMIPVGNVTWGQTASITCSISTQHLGGTFTLQQSSGSFRKSQTSSTNSVTFNIPQVTFSNEGSYQCQYQTRISGRDFSSPQSDPVRVSVTGKRQTYPSISKSPVGELTWGQDVSITCSISTQHLGGTFTLQQTSGSFRKSQTSSTNSVTFNIPQVTFSNEGSYQCQYQTRIFPFLFLLTLNKSSVETKLKCKLIPFLKGNTHYVIYLFFSDPAKAQHLHDSSGECDLGPNC